MTFRIPPKGHPDRELVMGLEMIVRASAKIDLDAKPFSQCFRNTLYPQVEETKRYGKPRDGTPFAVVIEVDGHNEEETGGLLKYISEGTTTIEAYADQEFKNLVWTQKVEGVVGETYPSFNEQQAGAAYWPIEGHNIRLAPEETRIYLPTKEGKTIQMNYVSGELVSPK